MHKYGASVKGFIEFVRKAGVVGLAVAFILGAAITKIVTSLVQDIINPVIGIILGRVNLAHLSINIGDAHINYGAFIGNVIDFIVVAAVVYFGVKLLRLDKLDQKDEK